MDHTVRVMDAGLTAPVWSVTVEGTQLPANRRWRAIACRQVLCDRTQNTERRKRDKGSHTHTHTHTHIYIYIYTHTYIHIHIYHISGLIQRTFSWKSIQKSPWILTPESQIVLNTLLIMRRDSSVGIATRYELNGPGIESRWGRDFPHLSRPALGAH